MKLISVIIPYIRKDKIKNCIKKTIKNAGIPKKYIEILAEEDITRKGVPKMVKSLVNKAKGQYIAFIGDDCIPQKNWLKNALEIMETLPDKWGLIGLNDLSGRILPCHWLADIRLLMFLDGEFFHTGYIHLYCDNELMERCISLNRYKYALNAVIIHNHPLLKGESLDLEKNKLYKEIYNKNTIKHDYELYMKRKSNNWNI